MSRPLEARPGLTCGGTSWWFRCGAIESSGIIISTMYVGVNRNILTVMREIEQIWQLFAASTRVTRVGQPGVGISKFIEERVHHRIDR